MPSFWLGGNRPNLHVGHHLTCGCLSVASSQTAGSQTPACHAKGVSWDGSVFASVPWPPHEGITGSWVFRDWTKKLAEQARCKKSSSGGTTVEHTLSYRKWTLARHSDLSGGARPMNHSMKLPDFYMLASVLILFCFV